MPPDVDRARLFALVRAGFGQRRKMLRRSLAGLVDADAFAAAGIRPEARAEELGVADWGALARVSPAREHRPVPDVPSAGDAASSLAVVRAPAKLTLALRITGVRATATT